MQLIVDPKKMLRIAVTLNKQYVALQRLIVVSLLRYSLIPGATGTAFAAFTNLFLRAPTPEVTP